MMTAEEFMQLDEDEWRGYELVRGELVQVSGPRLAPKHGHRMVRLCSVFGNFADTNHIAFFTAFCFYALARNPDTVRSVDISAIRNERMPIEHDEDQVFETAPDFVIEIWAPTDRADVLPKGSTTS
jgi:Uma2 family endonuclease